MQLCHVGRVGGYVVKRSHFGLAGSAANSTQGNSKWSKIARFQMAGEQLISHPFKILMGY